MNLCVNHNQCIASAVNDAENFLNEKKLKFTPLRKEIFKLIWESHKPIKAYDLITKLKKTESLKNSEIKPITVYRILNLFIANNLVHKIESMNAFLGCKHPSSLVKCFFIICKICSYIEEGYIEQDFDHLYQYLQNKKFIANSINIEIFGICADCKEVTK